MDDIDLYRPTYSNSKNKSTASLFEARKAYQDDSIPWASKDRFSSLFEFDMQKAVNFSVPMGDLYGDKYLYGILDYDGDLVMPIEDNSNFSIIGTNYLGQPVKVQNFVADAYLNMKSYLNDQVIKGVINKNSIFNNIQPVRGYYSFDKIYSGTTVSIGSMFREIVLNNKDLDSKITNFKEFFVHYLNFLVNSNLRNCPVTKSSLVLFYYLKLYNNGITFSISDIDFSDDNNNYKHLTDDCYYCFSRACIRYGLNIEKNVPYIMFPDLASPAFKQYLNRYNIKDVKDLFVKRYKKVYLDDIEGLKELFYNGYIAFLQKNQTFKESVNNLCSNEANNNRYLVRPNLPKSSVSEEIPELTWYSLYIYLKNIETMAGLTQQDYELFIDICKSYLMVNKREELLKLINDRIPSSHQIHFFKSLQDPQEMVDNQTPATAPPILIFRG